MSDYSNNYKNVSSALQKAREVAAKLQLAGPNKRSQEDFDDNEPHSKRFSSGSMSPAHLQQAQHAAAQVAARLGQQNSYQQQQQHVVPNPDAVEKAKQLISKFIPQGQGGAPVGGSLGGGASSGGMSRPGLGSNNYTEIMVPGSKVGLIIGKGGETIKQLQERTGAKMVVIQDGPGQEMEKPLRISGDAQKVEHAKQLVYELLEDKGPPQSQQGGGGRGGSFNNRNQEHSGGNGGGHNNYGNSGGGGGDQIEVFVPKAAVGVVIGKGGDMIKKIQADTGCRLQFLQTKNEGPGDRRCILQGTKQQVDDGKRMIEDLIESVMRRNNGEGGGGNRGGNDNWNSGSGSSNNSYQQQHQQQSPSSMGGGNGGGSGVQVVQHQYQFIVPASKCGIIIGRGGDTIKQINQQSGAHCEMDRKASQNQTNEKTFTVKGEQHQVDEAKRLIQDKINMDVDLQHIGSATVTQSSNGFGGQSAQNPYQTWGAGNGSYNQGAAAGWDQSSGPPMQPSGAPGGNQADYSLQWIEYYRSMGMHQQADAIEAQVKTRQPTPGAPPSVPNMMPGGNVPQQPQPQQPGGSQDNVRDYSQEWANYYRQIGRVDEAEAIERQIKTRGTATSNPPAGYGDGNYQPPQQQQQQQQQQYQPQQQYGQQYGNYNYQQYGQNNSNDKNCRTTRFCSRFRKYYPRYRPYTH